MSWHFSRALVAAYSEGNSLDGAASAALSLIPMPQAFCSPARMKAFSRLSRFGMMCSPLRENLGEAVLTWFLADFLAQTSLLREQGLDWTAMKANFGASRRESLARYDPDSHSWKTRQLLLFGGGFESLPTLPAWGMTVSGELWALKTPSGLLELRASITSERESGLLPPVVRRLATATATATDYKRGNYQADADRKSPCLANQIHRLPTAKASDADRGNCESEHRRISPSLFAKIRMPTPRANDAEKRGDFDAENPRNGLPAAIKRMRTPLASDGKAGWGNLSDQIKRLRTPTATDADKWNQKTAEERKNQGSSVRLPNQLGAGGQQSPMWTEWFMGFPVGWSALEPLGWPKFQQWLNSHGKR